MTAVLVIDDDPDLSECMRELLSDEGFDVRVAHDARTAARLIEERVPDVMTVDLTLGERGLDGDALLDVLQSLDDLPLIRTVIASGDPNIAARIKGLAVDAILSKPFEIDELLDAIRPPHRSIVQRVRSLFT